MIQFVAGMIPEVVKLLKDAIKDPETYEQLEVVRQLIEKVTGKKIEKNGLVALLETTTQGEPYTGKWEILDDITRRMRWQGGWVLHITGANPIFIPDK